MANYIVSDTNLTAVANAIRQKGGTSASLEFPDDFVEAIGDIQTGGGSSVIVEALNVTQNGTYTAPAGTAYSPVTVAVSGSGTDYLAARLNNTLTSYSSSDVTSIPKQVFNGCSQLQSVSFPNATSIGEYAFNDCLNLASVSAPNVTTISQYAFSGCAKLTSAPLDSVTSLAYSSYCFSGCTSLKSVSLPSLTLTAALPQYCFRACSSLTNVELPSDYTGELGFGCFASCSNLEMIDCQKTQEIPGYCFNGSSSLTTIVIRRTSVATLSNISAFTGTPFASGGSGGTLYVPNDLISSYQSASNWSTILGYANNQIKKIEGSIYE